MQSNWTGARLPGASVERSAEVAKARVGAALAAIANGELVIVTDDEDRENEGDLIMAAELTTPTALGFMVRHTSGLICVSLEGARLDALHIPQMVASNSEALGTAFTVSVDYKRGTSTGISAADRATTILALVDPEARPEDFARPGHVFPLRYREGGVLKRAGHTEAAVDLARLACLRPAGILAEIVNTDGSVARFSDLERFAEVHGLVTVTIADLVAYRLRRERLVVRTAAAQIPCRGATFTAYVYRSALDSIEHVALVLGDVAGREGVLVRVHSECLTGDVFNSQRCDCGEQLNLALDRIVAEGSGAVVYLRGQEGRGIGLTHKLRAYTLQDNGLDTVDANLRLGFPPDSREYGIGAQILVDLGITSLRLMTNNPSKYLGLGGFGIKIVERLPHLTTANPHNTVYLQTKQYRMGHMLGDLANDRATGTQTPPQDRNIDSCT